MQTDRPLFDRLLDSVLAQLGLKLESDQASALYQHYALLMQWNRRINLTSITDPEKVVFRHFGESLAAAKVIGAGAGAIVDIGSGAGFPGGPIAVLWPQRRVTLVESAGKKAVFLKEIARIQPNLRVFGGRFEVFQGPAEWATMRGVASQTVGRLDRVAERAAMIGAAASAAEAAEELGLAGVVEHSIPWDPRTVVVVGRLVPRGTKTG
jgi:16S rRNA (guanine527-N7)-methyltransferase